MSEGRRDEVLGFCKHGDEPTDSSSFQAENHQFHVYVTIFNSTVRFWTWKGYLESESDSGLYQVLEVLA